MRKTLLSLVMLVFPLLAFAQTDLASKWNYSVGSDGTVTLNSLYGSHSSHTGNLDVPQHLKAYCCRTYDTIEEQWDTTWNYYDVVALADNVFRYDSMLTSVTIHSNITRIPACAFGDCHSLTSVSLPSTIIEIDWGAFGNCFSLTSFNVPSHVSKISRQTFFQDTSLQSVSLPTGLDSIDQYAFGYCFSLQSILLPSGLQYIGHQAFQNCINLQNVNIPNTVTYLGVLSFYNTNLNHVTLHEGLEYIGAASFLSNSPLTVNFNCPNAILSSENESGWSSSSPFYIYSSGSGLNTVSEFNFGTNITEIPNRILSYASDLNSIDIPNHIHKIGDAAFSFSGLREITIPYSIDSIASNAFLECDSLFTVNYNARNVVVTGIDWYYSDWYYCFRNAHTINFGDNVESIPYYFACGDTNLTTITLPQTLRRIGYKAFLNTHLAEVNLPDSLRYIGNSAFQSTWLHEITIPKYVDTIGEWAFRTDSLQTINYNAISAKKIGADFTPWSDGNNNSISQLNFGPMVQRIPNKSFRNLTGLTSVVFPSSLQHIGDRAFYRCSGLQSIDIPDYTDSVGGDSFYGCTGLRHIEIGERVSYIGGSAFSGTTPDTIALRAVEPPQIDYSTFMQVPTNVCLVVPCGTASNYQNAAYWNVFTNITEPAACYVTINAVPNDPALGSVTGGGLYSIGDVATLIAIPAAGCWFTSWQDGNTDNPRQVVVSEEATYVASFASQNGVDGIDQPSVAIHVSDGKIIVEGANGMPVSLYDMTGRVIRNESLSGVIYMVKVGNHPARKVVVIR